MPDGATQRPAHPVACRAAFAPETWNPDKRTVDVVWSTGAPVRRMDWWTNRAWTEILELSKDAVDLSRMNAGAPVLNTHSSWSVSDVIGVVEDGSARIVGGEARATVRFSDRPEVASVVRDVAGGILRNISVGYVVDEWAIQEATPSSGEVRTAKRWTPHEISLVPIPADAGAQVRSEPPRPDIPPPAARAASQEAVMPEPTPEQVPQPAADVAAIRAVEQQRATDILVIADQASQPAEWARGHIAAGTAIDQVRAEALAAVAARSPSRVNPRVQIVQDEGDVTRRLLENAMEHRAKVPDVTLEDGARQFRGFRLLDFARASLDLSGIRHRGLTPIETFRAALRIAQVNRLQRDGGSHTTGDFPDLLANTASKMLRRGYGAAPRTFVPWTTQMNLPDFKTFKAIALSGAPALAAIDETGEVTYGTIGEASESWNLVRYGKALSISYVAMVNDDMSGFTRVPQQFGSAAARLENEIIYGTTGILAANAAMGDGTPLFHANHNNTSTGVLSVDATGVANVAAANNKLRRQKAPNGEILGLTGRFLLVPSALEVKAQQLFSAQVVAATAGAVNPMRTTMQVIGEPRLDDTSTVAYYLMADPNEIDTIAWGYLDGEEGPQISSDVDFDTDGMKTKVMHNFGAKALDWRGMVYSTGA